VKVEASKYTEVGYVGRDVESMVRDLVETSIEHGREEKLVKLRTGPKQAAEERVLGFAFAAATTAAPGTPDSEAASQREMNQRSREKIRAQLREGKLARAHGGPRSARAADAVVRNHFQPGRRGDGVNLKDMLSGMFGQQRKSGK